MSNTAKQYEGQRVADLIPVLAYEPDSHLFFTEDQSLCFAFQCEPLPAGDESAADRINTLLNNDWPNGTLIQFSLWVSPDVTDVVSRFKERRIGKVQDRFFDSYISSVTNFVEKGTRAPIIRDAQIRSRNINLLITCKLPLNDPVPSEKDMENAKKLQGAMSRSLQAIGIPAAPVDRKTFLRTMETLLNWTETPGWKLAEGGISDTLPLNEQIVDYDATIGVHHDGLEVGDAFVKTLSIKRFPKYGFFGLAFNYLGDFASGSRGIRENVLITATLRFPDAQKARSKVESKRNWTINQAQGPLLKFIPELARKKAGFDSLYNAYQENDRTVEVYLGMVLFAEDRDHANAAASNAKTYWAESGFQLTEDRFIVLPCFLNCLPFGADREAVRDLHRYKTMATRHCIPMLPLFGDWKGTGTADFLLFSRNGQVMSMSLYDSDASFNGVVAAQSGSGKSFFTNEIISSYLSLNGQVWAIDVGGSYAKICDVYKGDFLEFEEEREISINPFPLVEKFSEEEDVLTGLVIAMAAPTESLTDLQQAEVKRALGELWREKGKAMTVDDLEQRLLESEDQRVRDIGRQLYPFTRNGEYGKYMQGENTISFRNRFTVLELEALKGRRHLQQVVLLELIYQIQQAVYRGDRNRPRILIIDEAWDLLSEGAVSAFINDAYRRFRKYGAAVIVVLQSISDLYDNPVGRAIADNSPNKYILNQASEAVDRLKETKQLSLSNGGYDLLKTVHTIKGVYSEIFCSTNRGTGIGRLVVDPFRLLMYSTDPKDVQDIKLKRELGLSVEDAINQIIKERGMAR